MRRTAALYAYLLLLILSACATPVMPSGGPPDQTPPVIVEMTPAADAVNVTADAIRITFSEYVDAASFARAVSITPALDGRTEYSWRGRTVTIELPAPLRANTTYVVTLDTNLRDVNGVTLAAPITAAFSTGPTINRGRLAGRVVEPERGRGVAGIDVYAYAAPDSVPPSPLPDSPDYRTQTDEAGRFTFSYLSEQPYFVVAIQDRNRNRTPDPLEPFAVPPYPALLADSTQQDTTGRWLVTVLDSVPPEAQRGRALSDRRLVVRFSEPVLLAEGAREAWSLHAADTGRPAAIEALYRFPDDPFQVYALTEPLASQPYLLEAAAVVDTSGNLVRTDTLHVTPPAGSDTLGLRFQAFVPDTLTADPSGAFVLPPGTAAGTRFNQPVDSIRLHDVVAVQDTTGVSLSFTTTSPDGVTYLVEPDLPLQPGTPFRITVDGTRLDGPDSLYARTFQHMSPEEVGELTGTVLAADTSGRVVVELYPAGGNARTVLRRTVADDAGRFLFRNLPAGSYRLRIFLDRNANRQWDGGRIVPYVEAEPLTWSDTEYRVRARWETALPDTLRVGDVASSSPDA